MKNLRPILLAAATFAAGAITGCTTVNSVENAQPVAQKQMVNDKRVLTDASLDRKVRIVGVNAAVNDAGFLKIQVEVQNTTRQHQSFTYRIEWFDQNGMIINLPSYTAMPRSVEGKESIFLSATAPTERARDFRIKFLETLN
jgi:uncharacterized protein YcfL